MCSLFRITLASAVCALVIVGGSATHHASRRNHRMDTVDFTQNEVEGRAGEDSWWPSAEFALLQKLYDDCSSHSDLTKCLKTKAYNALSRAVDQDSIQIADGLTLVKQSDATTTVAEPRFFQGMAPEDRLDAQLRSKFQQLINTHTISMDLASEGRGKGKKVLPYLLLGVFTTISIVGGIALKTLAAIAGKALIASKVALTIAGIIALRKLFSHDGGNNETTFQVHADGHNRRNYYVVRPAKQASVDPYRFYHDQSPATPTAQ